MLLLMMIMMVVVITLTVYFHSDLAPLLSAGTAVVMSITEAA
jgi:hypothetical protein